MAGSTAHEVFFKQSMPILSLHGNVKLGEPWTPQSSANLSGRA